MTDKLFTVTRFDPEGVAYSITVLRNANIKRIEFIPMKRELLLFMDTDRYKFTSQEGLQPFPKTNEKGQNMGGIQYGQYMEAEGLQQPELLVVTDRLEVDAIWFEWNPDFNLEKLDEMQEAVKLHVAKKQKEEAERIEREKKQAEELANPKQSPIVDATGEPYDATKSNIVVMPGVELPE